MENFIYLISKQSGSGQRILSFGIKELNFFKEFCYVGLVEKWLA